MTAGEKLTGEKRALVTGAAAGLGLAIVERLLAEGWHVVAVDRDGAALTRMENEAAGHLVSVVADLSEISGLEPLGAALAGAGQYRLVIMNAGINATGRFETIPIERQQATIAVNLTAPMALTAALLRSGAVADGGSLIYVSSLSRYVGYPGAATYAATKEGLAAFARSLRKTAGRHRVKVLTVCPGPLDTAHAAEHAPPGADAGKRMKPDDAARRILAAARRPALAGVFLGGNVTVPGLGPKCAALAGRCFPGLATRMMRKLIFEKM
jgi:short-subunit dehydrogenase